MRVYALGVQANSAILLFGKVWDHFCSVLVLGALVHTNTIATVWVGQVTLHTQHTYWKSVCTCVYAVDALTYLINHGIMCWCWNVVVGVEMCYLFVETVLKWCYLGVEMVLFWCYLGVEMCYLGVEMCYLVGVCYGLFVLYSILYKEHTTRWFAPVTLGMCVLCSARRTTSAGS